MEHHKQATRPTAPAGDDVRPQFFVTGIGASAGGLEPMLDLVKNIGLDSMALVVVQHLSPDHDSALPEILQRSAPPDVEVRTAQDGEKLAPKTIYVIPPNADLAVSHGALRVSSGRRSSMPIDGFFRSLADELGQGAVGVVLSGTGSDGAHGLQAIQAAGGVTVVQDPTSAKHDGMPARALAALTPDFVLPPLGIASELSRICKGGAIPELHLGTPDGEQRFAKLIALVRHELGHDLDQYKLGTIERRVERRMLLHRMTSLDEYIAFLATHRDEIDDLFRDVMISVTSFFRDREVWDALATRVIPRILRERGNSGEPIRAWVAGCATGEEAYSLAILLAEAIDKKERMSLQIFATDISVSAIQRARRGIYGTGIERDVSPERLARFFARADGGYQVSRHIRDVVVFSAHNVLRDPPFSRIDIASCRNVLIYLKPAAQKRALRALYYSLQPTGMLLLGQSETVGDAPELFSLFDRNLKLYMKKPGRFVDPIEVGAPPRLAPSSAPPRPVRAGSDLERTADRRVLDVFGPPGVVVNEQLEILQFRGQTGAFLEPAPGTASFELMRLARPELRLALKRAIDKAKNDRIRASAEVRREDGVVHIEVLPFRDPTTSAPCFAIVFVSEARARRDVARPAMPDAPAHESESTESEAAAVPAETTGNVGVWAKRVETLERELEAAREYVQSVMEENESAKEQLKAANEELQSSNEELQSINEELETQREEMQSSNEELTTINEELQNRMVELGQVNDDLHNVLAGVDNAVIIIGMDLRIRRYTNAAETLFRLVPTDIGRPVAFLNPFIGARDVAASVSTVIETLSTLEEEVLASNQRWYALKIAPYRTLDHTIRGAVLSLSDIDVKKRASDLTRDVGAYAERALAAFGHPLLMIDDKQRVVWANAPFLGVFELAPEETVGATLPTLAARLLTEPAATALKARVERLLGVGEPFRGVDAASKDGAQQFLVGGSLVPLATRGALVLLSIEHNLRGGS